MKTTILLFVVIFLSGCAVINPARKSPYNTFVSNATYNPFDAIIVPGVPYNGETWSSIMNMRVYWAKFLYENGYAKNIIFSGGAVYSPYVESKVMALFAEKLGIPKENIFTEEKAEHSTENVYYSYYLAKEKGFKNVALASDPYQTNNLRVFMRKYNFQIKPLPILFDTLAVMQRPQPKIDASSAMVDTKTFISITERESFFKRLRGTMGKNISFTEEDEVRRKERKKS